MATAQSTGALAVGTTVVFTGKVYLNGFILLADGTNAATVTIYDNTAASGTVLAQYSIVATGVAANIQLTFPVRADTGLTVVVAGTGAQAIVYWGAGS